MNVVKEIQKINEEELRLNISDDSSWHSQYKNSAYVYVGGLDYRLSEGDVICILSQFGEVVDCNLIRDKKTGTSRGFSFVAFEDQRSTILAVDNLNGFKLLNRTLRVDHVKKYRRPVVRNKDDEDDDEACPGDNDEEYDERRKRIWNYELYQQVEEKIAESEPVRKKDEEKLFHKEKDRMQQILEKRREKREMERLADKEYELQMEAIKTGMLPASVVKDLIKKQIDSQNAAPLNQPAPTPAMVTSSSKFFDWSFSILGDANPQPIKKPMRPQLKVPPKLQANNPDLSNTYEPQHSHSKNRDRDESYRGHKEKHHHHHRSHHHRSARSRSRSR